MARENFDDRLHMLLDVPLRLTVELGRSRMLIEDLLRLSNGSVVELDRLAGEPLDVKINGKLVARGEAVVVNERLGVRITEIVDAAAVASADLRDAG